MAFLESSLKRQPYIAHRDIRFINEICFIHHLSFKYSALNLELLQPSQVPEDIGQLSFVFGKITLGIH